MLTKFSIFSPSPPRIIVDAGHGPGEEEGGSSSSSSSSSGDAVSEQRLMKNQNNRNGGRKKMENFPASLRVDL